MRKIQISIPILDDILKFVDLINECEYNVYLTNGQYDVPAKSLMVILTLDTVNDVYVYTDDEYYQDLLTKVEPYRKEGYNEN